MRDHRRQRRPFWYLRRGPKTVRDDVDEELDLHLRMRTDELRARGLSPGQAHRRALEQFGDIETTRRTANSRTSRKSG